jgi:hypothetical protein
VHCCYFWLLSHNCQPTPAAAAAAAVAQPHLQLDPSVAGDAEHCALLAHKRALKLLVVGVDNHPADSSSTQHYFDYFNNIAQMLALSVLPGSTAIHQHVLVVLLSQQLGDPARTLLLTRHIRLLLPAAAS